MNRTMPRLLLLTLFAVTLLACRPADILPDNRPGGMPLASQDTDPTPPPTPTPLPTTCITGQGEDGTAVEDCYTPQPERPAKYEDLAKGLDSLVQDAEQLRDSQPEGTRGASDSESTPVGVLIRPKEGMADAGAKIVKWLEEQDIQYKYDGVEGHKIRAAVPVLKLAPLSQLEAVQHVYRPAVPVIPDEPVSND